MKQFIAGLIVGSLLTGTLVGAAQFYDSSGHPAAPSGSVQQFDYFRQRQQFLDLNAIRRATEEQALLNKLTPCAR